MKEIVLTDQELEMIDSMQNKRYPASADDPYQVRTEHRASCGFGLRYINMLHRIIDISYIFVAVHRSFYVYQNGSPYIEQTGAKEQIPTIKMGAQEGKLCSERSFFESKLQHESMDVELVRAVREAKQFIFWFWYLQIMKIVRAIRNGWIKPKKSETDKPRYYMIWDQDDTQVGLDDVTTSGDVMEM